MMSYLGGGARTHGCVNIDANKFYRQAAREAQRVFRVHAGAESVCGWGDVRIRVCVQEHVGSHFFKQLDYTVSPKVTSYLLMSTVHVHDIGIRFGDSCRNGTGRRKGVSGSREWTPGRTHPCGRDAVTRSSAQTLEEWTRCG